ncbi:hypothetical protein PVL29_011235 [Vitis rotundifolia]|uniref:Pentatricopeptide repeat-containing protein n=1 Tax=Vitis rotundifolia TaxID=103349 RepID=A0AA38ZNV5_VITRO|nr:hypothetical protein PVL29_011235 [Vitis rotundifolia]
MDHARFILDQTPSPTDFSWNSLIRAYTLHDSPQNSLAKPSNVTYPFVLKSCSNLSSVLEGEHIHTHVLRLGFGSDLFCFCLDSSRILWVDMGVGDEVSWNSIISGYLFEEMPMRRNAVCRTAMINVYGKERDFVEMLSLFSGCFNLGEKFICTLNGLELNVILATALVDMYAKCGKIDDACLVFVKTSEKDVVALWNAMILGLAYHGDGSDSLAPNDVAFIGGLSACNHSGLVEEGRVQFSSMADKHGLSPKLEHCACMVDLLGRAGHLKEAYELVQNMDPNFCILLSNFYVSAGRWKDVARVRRQVKAKRIEKDRKAFWLFVVEDTTHLKSQEIYSTYEILIDH